MSDTIEPPWPGFWPRLGALVVDWLTLAAPLMIVGALAFDTLASLGSGGRLIGLVAGLLYFGLLESRIGGGQSLGKRLFRLRVTGADGAPLSPGRAGGRALLKIAPFIANGVSLPSIEALLPFVVAFAATVSLVGVGLAQLYLYIFNRPSRRVLHDLMVGSVVVKAGFAPTLEPQVAIHRRIALGIVGSVGVLVVGLMGWGKTRAPETLRSLQPIMVQVQRLPEVLNAGVHDQTTTLRTLGSESTTTRTLVVVARLRRWPATPSAQAQRVAEAVLRASELETGRQLSVSLQYGYELGFASGARSYSEAKPVAAWRSAVGTAKTQDR